MIISCIAAIGKNNEIGVDDDLPWYLPDDLKYFKKTTLGRTVLLGRKNLEAIIKILGKPLPNRTNIVVTRNKEWYRSDVKIVHSIEAGIKYAQALGEEELFIIGGGTIYAQSMHLCDRLYLTEVEAEIPSANVFFPTVDFSQWKLVSQEAHQANDKNKYDFCFKVYHR